MLCPDLCLYGFNGSLQLCVTDKKNDTSNSYSVEVGETDDNQFCYCFKVENLKLLPWMTTKFLSAQQTKRSTV